MSNKTPYYKSDTIGSLTNYFLKELVNCELIKENSQKIKSSFFDIFAKEKFILLQDACK